DILGDRRAASPLAPAQDCIILSPFRHPRGRRGRHDWKTIVFAALACGVCRGCSPRPCWLRAAHAAQLDPARMSADTIRALEQRLTDAGCYKGAIDGKTGEALDAAIKACPDQRPILRIETGMHTAPIHRIGVDAACSLLATASDDKTVRLWSLPDGRLKRVVRLPIGEGDAGKVFATALSPDGRWLAAGGWDAAYDTTGKHSLTIVDLSSGAVRRVGAFENVINEIAFSADGRRVAVGLGGNNGVRVLDSATGDELHADRDYGARVYGLAFAPDGGLIASSDDGQLRRYGPDLKLTAKRGAPDGKDPYGVAIDPAGRRRGEDIAAGPNSIFDIQPCGEGFVFATAEPSFGLVSAQGVAKGLQGRRSPNMRGKPGPALTLSRDAASVRFGLDLGEAKAVLFDLAAASLADSPNAAPSLAPAKVDGLPVTDWENKPTPKFHGKPLALEDYETPRALAVRPGGSGFVLATDWWVRTYGAKGNALWTHPGPGVAWGVDFSADGDIVVVAYGDGTIRWLRWSDGQELLALFVEPQSRKWVAWTPSGYYMASAGGEDLIGWHVNRGWTQEADFFPASQFRADYNRPDIVRLVLQTKDEAEAVRRANATAKREIPAKPIGAALPPVVTITSPADGSRFSSDSVEIGYTLRSPSGLPVDKLDVLADGVPVPATGFERTSAGEAKGRVVASLPRKDGMRPSR